MIVPRGGKSLVARVQADARVPVLAHLDGICHTYIHAAADPEMARAIALNAKMRRTGICGAMETLLLDTQLSRIARAWWPRCSMPAANCAAMRARRALDPRVLPAERRGLGHRISRRRSCRSRWSMGWTRRSAHIAAHSSHHTDAIVTADDAAAERFLAEVDSAIVMVNASSQFADGGEFGLGAEIGIATGRLHARGPVALEGLTTYKWQVRGTGQTRP